MWTGAMYLHQAFYCKKKGKNNGNKNFKTLNAMNTRRIILPQFMYLPER
jgi:hypothetical protein